MPFLTFFLGSFAVQNGDHLRSGIICGTIWGSFAVLVSFAVQFGDHLRFWDHLRSWDHLRTRTDLKLRTDSIRFVFTVLRSFILLNSAHITSGVTLMGKLGNPESKHVMILRGYPKKSDYSVLIEVERLTFRKLDKMLYP